MEDSLAAAEKALQRSNELNERRSKREGVVGGTIGSVIEKSQNLSQTVQAVAPVANDCIKLLQSRIDNLTTNSEMIMNGLDDVAKIHPFISAVVLAFKTAIKLEVTRRQNDRRILAVRVAMNDLFSVLLLLKKIGKDEPGEGGLLIEQRLAKRISSIGDDIRDCTTVCDTFQSKRTIVKLFRSLEWEGKLKGFIAMFEEHKKAISFDLSMHTSIRIEQVHTTLTVAADVAQNTSDTTSMMLLLQHLRSPEELELTRYINSRGGPKKFLENDDLMLELIKKSGEPEGNADTKGPPRREKPTDLVQEIKRDVRKTVADLISENLDQFMGKFDAQQEQLQQQMDASVQRVGDRVITAITGGPHERIMDPDLYSVWKDMGWKSTTKARHLVMALREFYSERRKDLLLKGRRSINDMQAVLQSTTESNSRKVSEVENISNVQAGLFKDMQDEWALEYITISRIQPLLEAFDDDASSLVSVAEVNDFTAARPKDWSLPQWMAFWTAGFPLALKHYYTRVQVLLSRMSDRVRNVQKVNRSLVDTLFCKHYCTKRLDMLFAGVYSSVQDVYDDYELFGRFKDYIEAEEARMQKTLHAIKYCIDADNTLELVTGPGRLEKHAIPLIYLLFVRAYQILGHAANKAIDPREVSNITHSLKVIFRALQARITHIKAICKLQNLGLKEQLQKVSHGMFYYLEFNAELPQSKFWSTLYSNTEPLYYEIDGVLYLSSHWNVCSPTYGDLDAIKDLPPGDLLYPIRQDSLDFEAYDAPNDFADILLSGGSSRWCGSYSYKSSKNTFAGRYPAGITTFLLPPHDDGFSGSGTDSIGEFTVCGRLEGMRVVFTMQYTLTSASTKKWKWRFEGTLHANRSSIEGKWGSCNNVGDDLGKRLETNDVRGGFDLHLAPLRPIRTSSPPHQQPSPPTSARERWRLAISAVRQLLQIKRGIFSWKYLQGRRRIRHRFLELFSRLGETDMGIFAKTIELLSVDEMQELSGLLLYCSKADLRFYRSFSVYLQRRDTVHWGKYCDMTFRSVITGPRYVCLDCLRLDPETGVFSNTVDLCYRCTESAVDRSEDNMHHTTSHDLLQLTCCVHRRLEPSTLKAASNIAQNIKNDDVAGATRRRCRKCGTSCKRPYWYCYDCPDNTCFCLKCKADLDLVFSPVRGMQLKHDIPRPKITPRNTLDDGRGEKMSTAGSATNSREDGPVPERTVDSKGEVLDTAGGGNAAVEGDPAFLEAASDGMGASEDDAKTDSASHSYEHKMILCREVGEKSSTTEPESLKLAVEKKFASLNERIDSLESKIMERLEQLMARPSGPAAVDSKPDIGVAE